MVDNSDISLQQHSNLQDQQAQPNKGMKLPEIGLAHGQKFQLLTRNQGNKILEHDQDIQKSRYETNQLLNRTALNNTVTTTASRRRVMQLKKRITLSPGASPGGTYESNDEDDETRDRILQQILRSSEEMARRSMKVLEPDEPLDKLSPEKERLMKVRHEQDGSLISRSLLGKIDDYHFAEQKRRSVNLASDKSTIHKQAADFAFKRRVFNNTSHQQQNNVRLSNGNIQFPSHKMVLPPQNEQQIFSQQQSPRQPFSPMGGSKGFMLNKHQENRVIPPPVAEMFNSFYFTEKHSNRNSSRFYLNDDRLKKAEDRHQQSQTLWDQTADALKSRVKSKNSLIERQKLHAIARSELYQTDAMGSSRYLENKHGKGVNVQQELRGFYQNLRGSNVAYTYTQAKNPYTMIWATTPSPERASEQFYRTQLSKSRFTQGRGFQSTTRKGQDSSFDQSQRGLYIKPNTKYY